MVRKAVPHRKRVFKAALALAGKTVEEWCVERDVTPSHLYQVLRGDRESAKLTAEIDAFIAVHAPHPSPAA